MRARPFLTAAVCLALCAGSGVHAETSRMVLGITIANGGFEQLAPNGAVLGWQVGAKTTGGAVTAAADVARSGVGSLRLSHPAPTSTTVLSEPIRLRVGHLYRLSGWIRARDAFSDPTARYPTAVPACLSMASFPLTNHSPTVGADSEWSRVETLFIATTAEDRVRLHLGHNGTATGDAWFDDIALEKVADLSEYIPAETLRRFGPAYRYDDRGWIFVHIEGEPYQRGYQLGNLMADEIVEYVRKLGVLEIQDDPETGWEDLRFMADAMLMRGYDREYLEEMRGIADGAANAGAEWDDRAVDLLDIVTLNSVVDLGQMKRAMRVTPHSLTGQSFLDVEDEMLIDHGEHKCSALAATGPATADGRVVFGQIFMWWGYTGVHWNVICDVQPSAGYRLVYQTFPGGIHSGADFYINSAGIIIGETTVSQTPYDPAGSPQSNRIRRAAQYASSIDEVADILWTGNNGMYTNDWPIADVKTDEVAILLLGTHARKLWRTSDDPAPFGTPGFLWANNNNRDPEVRKEYVAQPDDAPYDLAFSPWNRDLAFNRFYSEHKGQIDAVSAVDLWASSPVNRSHACDGKITTSEMAEELVFLAHAGKVTLREKFPGSSGRLMPDLPGADPHLSLGYSVVSPKFITESLRDLYQQELQASADEETATLELGELEERVHVDGKRLWRRTVYPASDAENWLVSASAAYWHLLHDLDEEPDKAAEQLEHELARLNCRYLYTVSRESDLPAVAAHRAYDRYGPYQIPRIKGTFALHQLRLLLGNEVFFDLMRTLHDAFAGRKITNGEFLAFVEQASGRDLGPFVRQWTEREGLPSPHVEIELEGGRRGGWDLQVEVTQKGDQYHLLTSLEVDLGSERRVLPLEITGASSRHRFHYDSRPTRVVFNPLNDFPVRRQGYYTWRNLLDDFHDALIVYGTSRQIEANHTMALRWQTTLADAYLEILPPVVKDSEITAGQAATHDLVVMGQRADNGLLHRVADDLPVELGKNYFRWQGDTFAEPDDGLLLVLPNPFNPDRVLYLVLANSAVQLYEMTRQYTRGIPSWARFKGSEVEAKGYHPVRRYVFDF